jgi:hypothetical protein
MALKDSRFLPALRARSIPVADRGDLAVRPTRPGRCRVLPATFAIAASPLVLCGSTAIRLILQPHLR